MSVLCLLGRTPAEIGVFIDPLLAFNVGCEIHMVDFVRRHGFI